MVAGEEMIRSRRAGLKLQVKVHEQAGTQGLHLQVGRGEAGQIRRLLKLDGVALLAPW